MLSVYVKDTQKYGRGIYAKRAIRAGECFEASPVIIFTKEEWEKYLEKTILNYYCFYWGENIDYIAMALGYGSLINHSYRPNATFFKNKLDSTIDFYAIRDIKKDEEITINYHGEPEDQSPMWFEVIE